MLTVACVLSPGPKYDRSHVARLEEIVAPHLKQPYRFVCVDDSPFPGWWAKISLFEPGRFDGRVLYLDLDVAVVGNLDDLADLDAPFSIINDWGRFGYNSSVMVWDAGAADHLFTEFTPDVMDRMPGDQDWITRKKPGAAILPRRWCYSYRLGLETGYPDDMRVCVYHGSPKPWEVEGHE